MQLKDSNTFAKNIVFNSWFLFIKLLMHIATIAFHSTFQLNCMYIEIIKQENYMILCSMLERAYK